MAHIFTPALRRPLGKPFAKSGTRTLIQRAIASLRARGTDAHLWLPGVGTLNGLTTGNYLESTGNSLATVDNPTGLVLDALGVSATERVTNGGFDTDTGWTKGSGWTISGGVASFALNIATSNISQTGAVETGKIYSVTYTIAGYSGANGCGLSPSASTIGVLRTGNGTYTELYAAVNTTLYVRGNYGCAFTIDNISVREVTGIHLTQSTTANKPVLRRGLVNLLTYSSDFSNAAWNADNVSIISNQAVAPDGTLTADKVIKNTTAAVNHSVRRTTTGLSGSSTIAVLAKAAELNYLLVWENATTGNQCVFDLVNGTTGITSGTPNASIAPIADGWYLCVIQATAATIGTAFVGSETNTLSRQVAGDGTSGIYIWNAFLTPGTLTASQILAAGGIPVTTTAAASNPDSGKYSWAFDGSNDSLLTGNLGITNACTIVIAGRLDSFSTTPKLFSEVSSGVQVYVVSSGTVNFGTLSPVSIVGSPAATVAAGTPFVITCRLSGGTAVIRKNGVQVATGTLAGAFAATTGARIGTDFGGANNQCAGLIGAVTALPVALTDAECLLVERMAASQFPNGPVF